MASEIGVKPVAGNQRRFTAKTATRMRPNQKFGTAWPKVAPSVAKRSIQERGCNAAAMPAATPTTIAMIAETTVRESVTGSRCITAPVTLTLLKNDVPRSP